jgi:hypothetical protein
MLLRTTITAVTFSLLLATSAGATIVTDWNEAALAELRASKLGPPVAARALAIAHTCMYDAWAAYDRVALGTVLGDSLRRPRAERTDAHKAAAISVAAYGCLVNLFPAGATRLAATMLAHGYDPTDASTDVTTPVGVGNVAAAAVIEARRHDGSNQYGDLHPGAYSDYTGYVPKNVPMAFCTPLHLECPPVDVADPNHWQPLISEAGVTQSFIAPHWEHVTPFALRSADQFDDRKLGGAPDIFKNRRHYEKNVDEILRYSRHLTPESKLMVEYWADGPASELPPGHWGLFAQFVSQRDGHSIDQDVKVFFAMHNASFDAGIVAWHVKRRYDGVRPITAIRFLKQGQIVRAYGGPGRPIEDIPGEQWMPYNPGSNLTPAFPGYISGHSTFSSASAEVLRAFTGSDDLGFSTVIPPDFGRVEPGIPSEPTTIAFATFSEAAEQAGLSRLYGGIHFSDDNTVGQALGALVGRQAWRKAKSYFDGTAR